MFILIEGEIMYQVNEFVDVNSKINDKISQIENRNHRLFTTEERIIAKEMFLSGFLFSQQWNGNEFIVEENT